MVSPTAARDRTDKAVHIVNNQVFGTPVHKVNLTDAGLFTD